MARGIYRIHLLYYLKFDKVLDIHRYLGPRKARMFIYIIQLISTLCERCKYRIINRRLTKFRREYVLAKFIQGCLIP